MTTPRLKKLRMALVVMACVYLGVCGVARWVYPRMLFPARGRPMPNRVLDPTWRVLKLPQKNGSHTAAIHMRGDPSSRTVVLFHGNGGTIYDTLDDGLALQRRGLSVLLVEYRGYGTTYGPPPDEEMLYEDGEAAIAWLKTEEKIPADRIAIWGWSLGSGVAAEMANRGHGAKVVLLAPFTSITAMGNRWAPVLPMSVIMSHRFDTLSKAPAIKQPTMVVHGDQDELIPFAMGERVAKSLPNGQLIKIENGHHTDLIFGEHGRELLDEIAVFLR